MKSIGSNLKRAIQSTAVLALIFSGSVSLAEVNAEFIYTVPVDDRTLEPFAKFELENGSIEKQGQQLILGFDMPDELVGKKPVQILLKGEVAPNNEAFTLQSPDAIAACRSTLDQTACNIRYTFKNKSGYSVSRHLKKIDPINFELRKKVAKRFSGDPIGTLIVKSK